MISIGSKLCHKHFNPRLQLVVEFVFAGEDVHASCIADHDERPRVMVIKDDKCNSKVEYLNTNGQNENCGQADFLVKNISTTCKYRCFLCRSRETKTISVVG